MTKLIITHAHVKTFTLEYQRSLQFLGDNIGFQHAEEHARKSLRVVSNAKDIHPNLAMNHLTTFHQKELNHLACIHFNLLE